MGLQLIEISGDLGCPTRIVKRDLTRLAVTGRNPRHETQITDLAGWRYSLPSRNTEDRSRQLEFRGGKTDEIPTAKEPGDVPYKNTERNEKAKFLWQRVGTRLGKQVKRKGEEEKAESKESDIPLIASSTDGDADTVALLLYGDAA